MASGDPRLSGKTVAVNDGAYNGVTKTQSLSRAASNYVTTPVGAYYVPANYTAINHISTDTSFVWYPTYLSRVTVPSGAGGPPQGSQFTGFIHDIEIGGQAQDCSAVFHSVYMHGQTASEEAETTGFYYNHQIGNSNPNDSLGKYYSSIIEGQQIFDNVGSGTRNGLGWWHLLWVRDSAVANLPSYAFITALNGLDTSTWAPLAGYATFYADRFLSCLGNWKAIFSAGSESTFKLNVSTVGIDLHTNTTWTDNIAALKIAGNTIIDLNGASTGNYIRYESADGGRVAIGSTGAGGYAAVFGGTSGSYIYRPIYLPNLASGSASVAVNYNTGTGQLYYVSSRVRYKTDIVDLDFDTSKLLSLRPRSYVDINDNEPSVGFIAEEVAEVVPELVVSVDDHPEAVNYQNLNVYLFKIVQKLEARIVALESGNV